MMKKRIVGGLMAMLMAATVGAQGVKPLPTLHTEGRWLVDQHGNHVVLHGVMDTPSQYFNNYRWGSWSNGVNYDANGASKCIAYFEKLYAGLEKANCTVFRLHLDPAWTNDPSSSYTYAGSKGQADDASGEADIKKFNPNRLKSFMSSLYWPLMQRAMNHGMYVVVRPPGVCPGKLKVGDYYQQYLLTVWDIVSQNVNVKKYAGQISIELANEPVSLTNANGQEDAAALHDYFQPIVDKIRANGFTGIIWAPGTGWQGNYVSYATHPIEGYNIGYAVHDYCGWYGCSDDTPSPTNKINQFHKQVPVVDNYPVIITEVDWSPKKPGTGHYNEHGDWVESNWGTWATGSTSKWGRAFKALLDHYGNISMTLSGTSCLIDVDTLINTKKVVPAFDGYEEACGKACMDWYAEYWQVDWPHADNEPQDESPEHQTATLLTASAESAEVMVGGSIVVPLTATYADGHQREVTGLATYNSSAPDIVAVRGSTLLVALGEGNARISATYTDPLGNELKTSIAVRSTFFPFGAEHINTSLFASGTYDEKTHTFRPGQWGQMGWEYPAGADMSSYKYLVIKLGATSSSSHLNIFTTGSIWGECHSTADFGQKRQIVVNLQTAKYTNDTAKKGQPLDTRNIRIVSFWGTGSQSIKVNDIYLTNNEDYSPTSVAAPTLDDEEALLLMGERGEGILFDLQGRPLPETNHLPRGIYIRKGRKILVQ